MKRLLLSLAITALPLTALAAPTVGQPLPPVTLSDKDGGRVDGAAWSSDEIKGKVYVMFYVDPDEKDLNDHVTKALKEEAFPHDKYGSIAVINMAATGLPNFLINRSLKSKQKEFPDTIYLKDMRKVLVKKWGIEDDNNDVLAFAPDGKLVFYRAGKLSGNDIQELIQTIETNLPQ
jgi:predicted transcriptional regulator